MGGEIAEQPPPYQPAVNETAVLEIALHQYYYDFVCRTLSLKSLLLLCYFPQLASSLFRVVACAGRRTIPLIAYQLGRGSARFYTPPTGSGKPLTLRLRFGRISSRTLLFEQFTHDHSTARHISQSNSNRTYYTRMICCVV